METILTQPTGTNKTMRLTFDTTQNSYEIPDEVAQYMEIQRHNITALQDELEHLKDAVKAMKVKEYTMINRPRKTSRLAYYQSRQELYNLVREVNQLELIKN
jgi:cell division septum initiation protein DivIVA